MFPSCGKITRQVMALGLEAAVNRRNEADEFGLIVVSDIASKVLGQNLSPNRVHVYEAMSKPVISLSAEMNIVYAVRLLTRFKLSRALVIDHDRNPLGIVTLRHMVLRNIRDIETDPPVS